MLELLQNVFDPQGFMPHGNCYLWKPDLVWLHVVSDSAIALAYYSIPLTLVYFVSKRKDLPFNWIFWMFGLFIIACGTGHLMSIWTLWHPAYYAAGFLKALTAIVSVLTALELMILLPKMVAVPSQAQLEAKNRELEAAMRQLQHTQSQLIQTEKMSSLGQLVAGVAHEINNPVNFIHGNLTHASQYTQDLLRLLESYQLAYPQPTEAIQSAIDDTDLEFLQEDLPKMITSMQVGTNRIRQIVLSLRNFARLDESEMKPVNLHEGLDSTLLILQNLIKPKADFPGVNLIKQYGDLPLVECYAGQLNQVFMNVLSNAIEALSGRETVPTIKITTQRISDNRVQIQISDNGAGMSNQTRERVFNPFFTTKPVGKGTGLGLSISYQIVVEKHGGEFECSSAIDKGSTFTIRIPIQQWIAASPRQNSRSAWLQRNLRLLPELLAETPVKNL